MQFKLTSEFSPTGDQPEAIRQLTEGVQNQSEHQVLLGVTRIRKNVYSCQRNQ